MSTSLYWSLVPQEPEETSVRSLKKILAKNLWDSDGSCSEQPVIINEDMIPYLQGIVDGSQDEDVVEDANILIEAIKNNGKIILRIS